MVFPSFVVLNRVFGFLLTEPPKEPTPPPTPPPPKLPTPPPPEPEEEEEESEEDSDADLPGMSRAVDDSKLREKRKKAMQMYNNLNKKVSAREHFLSSYLQDSHISCKILQDQTFFSKIFQDTCKNNALSFKILEKKSDKFLQKMYGSWTAALNSMLVLMTTSIEKSQSLGSMTLLA